MFLRGRLTQVITLLVFYYHKILSKLTIYWLIYLIHCWFVQFREIKDESLLGFQYKTNGQEEEGQHLPNSRKNLKFYSENIHSSRWYRGTPENFCLVVCIYIHLHRISKANLKRKGGYKDLKVISLFINQNKNSYKTPRRNLLTF